ncbi:hypothetical protein HGRIS_011295 [Hohenbuehelia grisea]|uniref:FAD binding domain-containing protein n=1 Tax=Hohenbuehelia grisea TaxID=104357 RepID=A0ABR3JUL9_9AGAR
MPTATNNISDPYVEPFISNYENKSKPNSLGVTTLPSYPDLLNGTNSTQPAIPNYKPQSAVDVLIVGAGPVGLTTAASLIRQGASVRILDRSPHPLPVGRADSLQPRTMEVFRQLGLGEDVFALGPRLEHTVVYKDGERHIFAESHRSEVNESRYQGLHDATQTEVEHLLIRDLIRHDILVERPCSADSYTLHEGSTDSHPITVEVTNHSTGVTETVSARYLVGADGAHSMIRKSIPGMRFDGIKTDLHWGIVDAVFETDFPHRWTFGTVLNSDHGGCLIIPRERDMVRLYAQLRPDAPGEEFDHSKWGPEEVLVQLNKIFAPYTLKYASPVDWYTILTISERVASTFVHKDRIFLVGDSCHVHSAKGAFGMNTGVMDAHNLAWKLALLCRGKARPGVLLDTYDHERRNNALRAVRTSARYLRFVGNCTFQNLDGSANEASDADADADKAAADDDLAEAELESGVSEDKHVAFFRSFAKENTRFLIGLDVDYAENALNRTIRPGVATGVRQGYRAPDPRVALGRSTSGRLYDSFGRVDQFTVLVFAGGLLGAQAEEGLARLDRYLASPKSFFNVYNRGGSAVGFRTQGLFKLVLVVRATPSEAAKRVYSQGGGRYPFLAAYAQVVFDEQLPAVSSAVEPKGVIFGGDAHGIYGVDAKKGAVVIVRPDTFVGTAVGLGEGEIEELETYFDGFLLKGC